MKPAPNSYFTKIKDPNWVRKKRLHYLMMPQWADNKCLVVLGLTLVGLISALFSCFFLHKALSSVLGQTGVLIIWAIGFFAILIIAYFFLKGIYQKFLDSALDVYY